MNKYKILIIGMVATMFALIGCTNQQTENDTLKIVTTIFPEYDWVREILGENIENVDLTMLLDTGVDLHSYQPTADDIIAISECDIFIYVGGESDEWVEAALENTTNEDMKVLNLMELLGDRVKEEELVDGMEAHDHDDEEHDDDTEEHDDDTEEHDDDAEEHDDDAEEHDDDVEEHDHEDTVENDEHVWLSLQNAEIICEEILNVLIEVDGDNRELYEENTASYIDSLEALDLQYENMVASASTDTILVADRFPFRYLVDDYDIDYYAAFAGCSAETEASFETIIFLAEKLDELQLDVVLTIEGSDNKIPETIIENTIEKDQTIAVLNSMQSITASDIETGITYLSIMVENYDVLEAALN